MRVFIALGVRNLRILLIHRSWKYAALQRFEICSLRVNVASIITPRFLAVSDWSMLSESIVREEGEELVDGVSKVPGIRSCCH